MSTGVSLKQPPDSDVELVKEWLPHYGSDPMAFEAHDALDRIESRLKELEGRLNSEARSATTYMDEVEADLARLRRIEDIIAENARLRKALHEVCDNADAGGPLSLVSRIASEALEGSE